jgi:hypothetical protein
MWDLVPYKYDNVLIRYLGHQLNQRAMQPVLIYDLNGELVEGAESWIKHEFNAYRRRYYWTTNTPLITIAPVKQWANTARNAERKIVDSATINSRLYTTPYRPAA